MSRMFDKGGSFGDRVGSESSADDPSTALPRERLDELARRAMAQLAKSVVDGDMSCAVNAAIPVPHVTAMANALAARDATLASAMVDDLLATGLSIDDLFHDHLTPAARLLGEWWETDQMTFTDVTLASARIQSILRGLPGMRGGTRITGNRGAIFTAVPGEEHTLGVSMAAEYFRRRGWDVGLYVGLSLDELCDHILHDDRSVVGISCSGRQLVPCLRRMIGQLRRSRPELAIVLSGRVVTQPDTLAELPQVDGVIASLEGAESVMEQANQQIGPRS